MDTMKDTKMQPATDVTIVPEATAEFIAGLLERIEQLESDLATAEQDSRQKQARIERLEEEESKQAALLDCLNEWKALAKSAEKERDALRAENAALVDDMNLLRNNNTALRAKVEAMQKQEPTRDWWDCLIADISAIDCMYRGSPTYAHDAYWMRDHVVWMLKKRRDALHGAKGE